MFLPCDLREWVPEDHIVHFIVDAVWPVAGRVLIWKFSPVWYAPAVLPSAVGLCRVLFHETSELPTVTLGVVALLAIWFDRRAWLARPSTE